LKNSAIQLLLNNRCFRATLAGLILASAFPNYNIPGLAWVAPALILFCDEGKSGRESLRIGYVAGLAFWLPTLSWLLGQLPLEQLGATEELVAFRDTLLKRLLAGPTG
jgi:apolipoprotein N-acyltransferase